jgi:hypothetical protein
MSSFHTPQLTEAHQVYVRKEEVFLNGTTDLAWPTCDGWSGWPTDGMDYTDTSGEGISEFIWNFFIILVTLLTLILFSTSIGYLIFMKKKCVMLVKGFIPKTISNAIQASDYPLIASMYT